MKICLISYTLQNENIWGVALENFVLHEIIIFLMLYLLRTLLSFLWWKQRNICRYANKKTRLNQYYIKWYHTSFSSIELVHIIFLKRYFQSWLLTNWINAFKCRRIMFHLILILKFTTKNRFYCPSKNM